MCLPCTSMPVGKYSLRCAFDHNMSTWVHDALPLVSAEYLDDGANVSDSEWQRDKHRFQRA